MDVKTSDGILEYSPDTVGYLRNLYGLDNPTVLNESITTLQNWINKQEHFVRKDFALQHLEWTILTCKGSIERAKERLDKYCTAKVLNPRMYEKLDVKHDFTNFHEFEVALLPKFTEDYYRVLFVKLKQLNKQSTDPYLDLYRYILVICEYMRGRYFNGIILIMDFTEVDVVEMLRITNIPSLREFIDLGVNCFGLRIKGLYAITSSKTLSLLMSLVKQVLSKKLFSRFYIFKSFEPLYNVLPKNMLPLDYGGEEKTLAELSEMWRNQLSSDNVTQHIKKMQEFRTDESRRQLFEFNNEYMGTPGSFRNFVVD